MHAVQVSRLQWSSYMYQKKYLELTFWKHCLYIFFILENKLCQKELNSNKKTDIYI
jgi:hypothetical protein